jgi:hypothetical protein
VENITDYVCSTGSAFDLCFEDAFDSNHGPEIPDFFRYNCSRYTSNINGIMYNPTFCIGASDNLNATAEFNVNEM